MRPEWPDGAPSAGLLLYDPRLGLPCPHTTPPGGPKPLMITVYFSVIKEQIFFQICTNNFQALYTKQILEYGELATLMMSWVNIFVHGAKFITYNSPQETLIRSLKHYFAESCVLHRQGTAALTISLKKEEI